MPCGKKSHKKKRGGSESTRTAHPLASRAMALMHQYKQAGVEHPLTKGWIQARREAAAATRRGGCGAADPQHKLCSSRRTAGSEEDRYVEVTLPVIADEPRAGGRRCRTRSGPHKGRFKKCKSHRKGGAETEEDDDLDVSEASEEDIAPRAGGARRRRRRVARRARSASRPRSRSASRSRSRSRSHSRRMGGADVLGQIRERAQELRAKAKRSGGSLTWNESLSLAGAEHRARSASL